MTKVGQTYENIYNSGYAMQDRRNSSAQLSPSQIKIPEYYDVPVNPAPKNFKEMLEENPIYSAAIKPMFGALIEHPFICIGTWLGIGALFDKYTDACGGKYENSLLKKIANFGDNIQESRFIQNKPVQTVLSKLNFAKKSGGRAIEKNTILKAMKETPSMPEWPLVKSSMFNQRQEVVQDFLRIVKELKLNSDEHAKLTELGLDKSEREMLSKMFKTKNLSDMPQEKAVNQILLQRLGKTEAEINKIHSLGAGASTKATKAAILKEMGLTKEKISLICEDNFEKYNQDVLNASKRVGKRVKIGAGHYSWLGPLTKPFERTISCDGIYNRLHSMGDGAKTATGRFMSKFVQMAHRGLTFGGGKLGLLIFIAPALIEAGINVRKAENKEKVSTGITSVVDSISWVFTFPLALKMMHSLGGAQYAGMGKDKVEQFRKIRDEFNLKNKQGLYANKADYEKARRIAEHKMDKLYNVKGQGWFTKGVRKLARFLMLDLDKFDGRNKGSWYKNILTKMPNALRDCVGVPMRVIIFGLLTMGVLDVAISKGIKAIFGDHYDPMKEEERKENKKAQNQKLKSDLNERLYDMQMAKIAALQQTKNGQIISMRGAAGVNNTTNTYQQQVYNPTDNYNYVPNAKNYIQNEKIEQNVDSYTYIPSSKNIIPAKNKDNNVDTYTYIPSSQCTIPQENNEQANAQRKYIPSQNAANIVKNFDNSGLESALNRADKAEKLAMKILSGNFEE